VISKDVNEINHLSAELFALLKPAFQQHLLGPEFPLIARIKNQYHKHILIKTSKQQPPKEIREIIFNAIDALQNNYKNWRYRISIDVDPV